jgi:hypothetical protein
MSHSVPHGRDSSSLEVSSSPKLKEQCQWDDQNYRSSIILLWRIQMHFACSQIRMLMLCRQAEALHTNCFRYVMPASLDWAAVRFDLRYYDMMIFKLPVYFFCFRAMTCKLWWIPASSVFFSWTTTRSLFRTFVKTCQNRQNFPCHVLLPQTGLLLYDKIWIRLRLQVCNQKDTHQSFMRKGNVHFGHVFARCV